MHVAIVGAGALGRVYGVRLGLLGHATATFVVRRGRESDKDPFRIARIDRDRAEHVLENPPRALEIPSSADVVLLCVRVEQLDHGCLELLGKSSRVPIVVLTPLLPADFTRLRGELGERVLAGMPGVVSYLHASGATRYWLPKVAPTLIDEPSEGVATVDELVAALRRAGMDARVERGVHDTNPATTVAFIPLAMGLDAAGSIEALMADRPLLDLSLKAAREGLALSGTIGRSAPWVGTLTRFLGPTTLRVGIALARSRWPEAVHYVEEHFGRKLHAQNLVMAEAIVRLAAEKGAPSQALGGLVARLGRTS